MRRKPGADDAVMVFHWVVLLALAPSLVLVPDPGELLTPGARLLAVSLALAASLLLTAAYVAAVKRSPGAAALVVAGTAALDCAAALFALLLWPAYVPDLFWLFAVAVVAVGLRRGYRETAAAALGLSGLYVAAAALGRGDVAAGTLAGDSIIRIALLLAAAGGLTLASRTLRRERREAGVIARAAAAMASTQDAGEILGVVTGGLCELIPESASRAYIVGPGGGRALYACGEAAPGGGDGGDPLEEIRPEGDHPAARSWREGGRVIEAGAGSGTQVLAAPVSVEGNVEGLVVVERRSRESFGERELELFEQMLGLAATGFENASRYTHERRKRAEADTLYRTLKELGSTLSVGQIAESACRLAMEGVRARDCTMFILDESRRSMVPRMTLEVSGFKWGEFTVGSEIDARALERALYSSGGREVLIENPEESALLPPFLRVAGTACLVPLWFQGRVIGLLCLTASAGREFAGEELSRLRILAGEAALFLVNARLYETIRTDAAQLSSLMQLTNAVGSTADLDSIMTLALDTARHLFDCSYGLIYRLSEEDDTLRYVDSFGYSAAVIERLTTEPYQPAAGCRAVAEGGIVSVDDLSNAPVPCGTLERIREGSTVCVGMNVEGRTLGVLHLRSEDPGAFRDEDLRLAGAIADQVALTLQRAMLFEEISRLAVTDDLTGVFNVRQLRSVLLDEAGRMRRYGRPVSMLMIDVDRLKSYNDTLGHQQGDVILSQVASILATNTREVDKVFRYGGDEFCIVLPEADREEAGVVAEKVRRAVFEFHFPGEEKVSGDGITVSVGLATMPGDAEDIEDLVRVADEAMYVAKRDGGNAVAAAVESPGGTPG